MGHKMSNRNEYRNLTQPFLEFVGRAVAFCFHIPKTRPFWMVMVLALGIPFRNFDDFNVSVKDDFILKKHVLFTSYFDGDSKTDDDISFPSSNICAHL